MCFGERPQRRVSQASRVRLPPGSRHCISDDCVYPARIHAHAKSVALPTQGLARSDPTDCEQPLSMYTDA